MKKASLFLFWLFLAIPCTAETIIVDANGTGDYPTIQAAINEANDGDIIELQPGTYTGDGNRDIDFLGRVITVQSESGAENCIIDCEGAGRGFYFHNGEDGNSVVKGFTIINGHASNGGGIYCAVSSPTLTSCTFSGNSAGHGGGGMFNINGAPVLNNCRFSGNSAVSGGGMFNSSSCNPVLTNCIFIGNSADTWGGGMYGYGFICSPTLTNCIFIGNFAGSDGGGMHNYGGRPTLTNCIFSGNSAGYTGGGMFYTSSDPVLTNCTFSGNSAGQRGGGICYKVLIPPNGPGPGLGSPPEIANGTIVGNTDTGIFYDSIDVDIIITNCIIWDDLPDEISLDGGSLASVSYSDVQGGWPGEGNIDADPLFIDPGYWDANSVWVDGDYHLLPDSPCIDAGDPNYSSAPGETDIDGEPRVIDGCVDIGADEYPGCFEVTHPDYSEWLAVGRPESWCYKYQCYGDADGMRNGHLLCGYARVMMEDLYILIPAWKKPVGDPAENLAADFDRKLNGNPLSGYSRVMMEDLNILIGNWKDDSGIPMSNPNCGGDIDLSNP